MSNVEEGSKRVISERPSTHALTLSLFGLTMPFDVITATYAVIVASYGVTGYVKAQSIPSLAAGLTFGCLLAAGSFLEAQYE